MTLETFPIRRMIEEELAALPDETPLRAAGLIDAIDPILALVRSCQSMIQRAPFADLPVDQQDETRVAVAQTEDAVARIELTRATNLAFLDEYAPLSMAQIDSLFGVVHAMIADVYAYMGTVRTSATPPISDDDPRASLLPFTPKERK